MKTSFSMSFNKFALKLCGTITFVSTRAEVSVDTEPQFSLPKQITSPSHHSHPIIHKGRDLKKTTTICPPYSLFMRLVPRNNKTVSDVKIFK